MAGASSGAMSSVRVRTHAQRRSAQTATVEREKIRQRSTTPSLLASSIANR
jgi:hypothetical protein